MAEDTNGNYFRAGDANWQCKHKHKTIRKALKCRDEEVRRRNESAALIGNKTESPTEIRVWEFYMREDDGDKWLDAKEVKPLTDPRWPQNLARGA